MNSSHSNPKALCGRLGISDLSLLGIRSSGSSSRNSLPAIVSVFWVSFSVHATTGVVSFRFRRAWRQVGERFGVGTLCTGRAVEFRQGRVIAKERLQTRRLRRQQLDLGVEDIQLHPCASVEPRLGQAQRFLGLLNVFFLTLNQLLVLLQI